MQPLAAGIGLERFHGSHAHVKIVADENIPGILEWCGGLGDITLVEGRTLQRAQLLAAEVLLVRSVTRVDAALLAGTPIRFVGSATSGIDHIDQSVLAARGICFAATPGCNARAVAEYILACCLAYAEVLQRSLSELTVGVVGCGHAGSAVVRLLALLGVRCLVSDPPRARHEPAFSDVSLGEVLRADIVTLHVPLVAVGEWPTVDLIGTAQIATMKPRALLINAARGGVLAEHAWLSEAGERALILDCWRGEPAIDAAVLETTWIASPHVAGHTVDARWRATEMLAGALAAFLGKVSPAPPPALSAVTLPCPAADEEQLWQQLVFACCDPRRWTPALKAGPTASIGACFDRLRKQFGTRREFAAHTVTGADPQSGSGALLQALGFNLVA